PYAHLFYTIACPLMRRLLRFTPCPSTTLFRSLRMGVAGRSGGRRHEQHARTFFKFLLQLLDRQAEVRAERHFDQVPRSDAGLQRSEEHTSELQSRFHLVFRLLLIENKKPLQRV